MDPKRPKDLSSHLVDLDWERCGCESKPLFFFKPAIPIGGVPPSLGAPACVCAKHCPFLAGDWEEPCGSSPLRPPQLGNGRGGWPRMLDHMVGALVFLCFRVQREGPLRSLHQFKETFFLSQKTWKRPCLPCNGCWGGAELRV